MSQKFSTVRPISIILRLFWAIFCLILILVLAFPIGFYGMAMYIEPGLPKTSDLKTMPLEMPLQIYTADNKLIGQYGNTYSMPIAYEDLPKDLINAFLAAEDDSFFEHSGISVKGLGRAITQMVSDSGQQTGGSTITQQVAKNYFLSPEQTFERKLTEMFLARRIENELTKNEIMTLYVNKIYLGQGAYGIKAGARRYYNKELHELTLAEMAMLAGLPKAPSEFNPVINPKRALERRDWILGRMLSQGYIKKADYDTAIASEVTLNMYQDRLDLNMPYLAEMARTALVDRYGAGVMNSGWRVQLTVDSKTQQSAEKALRNGLYAYHRRNGWRGASSVEAETGNIKALQRYDDIYPAQITKSLRGGSYEAVLNTGETITLRGVGRLKVDNIVRVVKSGNNWQLAQIPKVQGALVSLNPENGALIALVGGFHYNHSRFNRATQGYRQPGSIIKPLVYAAGIESKKYTPNSILSDTPLRIGGWQPKNADGSFRGGMSMVQALAVSRNIPVIRVFLGTGTAQVHAMLTNFGLEKDRLPEGAALALGAADTTPLQMATAYTAFVNGGHRIQPYFIERIYDFENDLVYQANPLQACALCYNSSLDKTNADLLKSFEKKAESLAKAEAEKAKEENAENAEETITASRVGENSVFRLAPKSAVQYAAAEQAPRILSPSTAYNMAKMLRAVITSGTGKKAQAVGRSDIGGKTGTTNQAKDAWFAGVHPTNATVVWIGFDDPKPLGKREYGGVAALPVWTEFMRSYLAGKPVQWVTEGNRSKSKAQSQKIVDITDDTPASELSDLLDGDIPEGDGTDFELSDGDIPEGDGEG